MLKADISDISAPVQMDNSTATIFAGKLNGAGHNVNLNINITGTQYTGLFSKIENGTVRNLNLAGEVSGNIWIGALAGKVNNTAISSVYNAAKVTIIGGNGSNYVGGLVGEAEDSTLKNVGNTGEIYGWGSVGGIAGRIRGYAPGTTITSASNTGKVTGYDSVGGIVGETGKNSQSAISYAYNAGEVYDTDGAGQVGGIWTRTT